MLFVFTATISLSSSLLRLSYIGQNQIIVIEKCMSFQMYFARIYSLIHSRNLLVNLLDKRQLDPKYSILTLLFILKK